MIGALSLLLFSTAGGGSQLYVPPQDPPAVQSIVWGQSTARFAPAQPTPVASQVTQGTHALVLAQGQLRSSVWGPFQGPSASSPRSARIAVAEQLSESRSGSARLWGAAAFAPAQPVPVASEVTRGAHELALRQLQQTNWVKGPFLGPSATTSLVRSFVVGEQPRDSPTSWIKSPFLTAPAPSLVRPFIVPEQPRDNPPSWVKGPTPPSAATPAIHTVRTAPQDVDLLQLQGNGQLWGDVANFAPPQPTPAAAEWASGTHALALTQGQQRSTVWSPLNAPAAPTVTISQRIAVAPQTPDTPKPTVWGTQIDPASFLAIEVEGSPQENLQTISRLWSPLIIPSAPQTPQLHFLFAPQQVADFTGNATIWQPQIAGATFFSQTINLLPQTDQNAIPNLWGNRYPLPSVIPTAPPLGPWQPFQAGPAQLEVASYGVARLSVWGQPPESVAPIGLGQTPAGRHRHYRRLFVHIDGQDFEVRSVEEARDLLERAKQLAQSVAPRRAEERLMAHLASTPRIRPKIERPRLHTHNPELHKVVAQARAVISTIYMDAYRDAEISLRLAARMRDDDGDDEDLMLLL